LPPASVVPYKEPLNTNIASHEASIAINIVWALQELLPDPLSDEPGDDLREVIEHWERIKDEQQKRVDQLRRRRIVSQFRLDIEPVSP
jgi:hypothetical protein